jgi:hypothetical protein
VSGIQRKRRAEGWFHPGNLPLYAGFWMIPLIADVLLPFKPVIALTNQRLSAALGQPYNRIYQCLLLNLKSYTVFLDIRLPVDIKELKGGVGEPPSLMHCYTCWKLY